MGCEASLADDLVQDTFVTVLEKPFCVKDDPATASYLRRVARNRFVDEMRRLRLKVADNLNEADLVWEEAAGDDDQTPYLMNQRSTPVGLFRRRKRSMSTKHQKAIYDLRSTLLLLPRAARLQFGNSYEYCPDADGGAGAVDGTAAASGNAAGFRRIDRGIARGQARQHRRRLGFGVRAGGGGRE